MTTPAAFYDVTHRGITVREYMTTVQAAAHRRAGRPVVSVSPVALRLMRECGGSVRVAAADPSDGQWSA